MEANGQQLMAKRQCYIKTVYCVKLQSFLEVCKFSFVIDLHFHSWSFLGHLDEEKAVSK
jgi:hypothetical protein